MEHISIKKKIDRVIIKHKIDKTEQINTMELDIINRGEIPALLPVEIRKSLSGKAFRFVVQSLIDLRSYLKSGIGFDSFAHIVSQIVRALQDCESHGIRSGNLELNCDRAFYDYGRHQVRLICWPLISLSAYSNVPAFFHELGAIYISTDKDSGYRVNYLAFFDSRAKFDLDAFGRFVESLEKQWRDEQNEGHDAGTSAPSKPDDIPPTVGLRTSTIQRLSQKVTINVTHYPFTLGRMSQFCDYAVEDNPYVSKRHVTILLRNNQTFIRDNGSANGTFLNDTRLPANTEVELHSGDTFWIGNEEFTFYAAGC